MKPERLAPLLQKKKLRDSDIKIYVYQHNDEPLVIPDPGNKEEADRCFAKYMSNYFKEPVQYWIPLDRYTDQRCWEDFDDIREDN